MEKNTRAEFPTRASMILHFLRGSVKWFVLAILSAWAVALLDLLNPKIIGFTVDSVIDNAGVKVPGWLNPFVTAAGGVAAIRKHLWTIALLVAGVAVVRAVFRYLFEYFNSRGAERLVKTMRDDLSRHILHLPYIWQSENATGDILQRCTSDVETVKVFLSEQLAEFFRTMILMALSLIFMFRIHVGLAAAAAVFIPVIVFYSLAFHRGISSAFVKVDSEEGKLSSIAQENLTGVRVVRAFGREVYERERFEKQNEYYTGQWVSLMRLLSLFWSSGDLVTYLQVLVILVYGSYLAVGGKITAGDLIAFISYNQILQWPVRALGRIIAQMSKAGVSIDRLAYIMNSEVEVDQPGANEPPMNRDIRFEHVSFAYENGAGDVLKDVSFTIKAGSVFGILGGTGSGKSTLMHLIDRLYDLKDGEGKIYIGDTDIAKIKAAYLREHVGMVLQEPYLFSRTISENIAITQSQTVLSEVEKAARIASLDDTIAHFTKGYDTYVGERGVTLSGGQKQRTAIAQMLVRKPEIMIFDDSLSAVDAETDAKIREALRTQMEGRTVILISHRISTLMHADQILVLDKGQVSAIGNHRELLQTSPLYHRIYDLQMKGAEEMDGGAGTAPAGLSAAAEMPTAVENSGDVRKNSGEKAGIAAGKEGQDE